MSTTYEDMLALAAGGARRKKKPAAHRQPPGLKAYAKFRKAHPGLTRAQLAAKWRSAKGRGLVGGCGELYPNMLPSDMPMVMVPQMMPQHPLGSGSYIGGDGGYMGGDGGALVGGKGRKKALRAAHAVSESFDPLLEAAKEKLEEAYKLSRYNWTCPPFYATNHRDEKSIDQLLEALRPFEKEKRPRAPRSQGKIAERLTSAILGALEKKE